MDSSKKYLITGQTEGQLGCMFKKLVLANEKNGPFCAAFIMGGVPTLEEDLSALFDLVKTDFLSTFPIYFLANKVKMGLLEDSLIEELAKRNVHFMRPFGISKTPEGLRFAYVSGVEASSSNSSDIVKMTPHDLEYVEEQYMMSSERDSDEGIIDVLFTWSWPQELSKSFPTVKVPESSRLGPFLWHLKPRYIFSPSHDSFMHYERAPYENVDTKTGEFMHSSRFISLSGALGIDSVAPTNSKKKWVYALNLVPGKLLNPATSSNISRRPDDCTSNPFLPVCKKATSKDDQVTESPNYFYQTTNDIGTKRRLDVSVSTSSIKRPPSGYICKKCHSGDHFFRDCVYKDSNLGQDSKSTYVCHICHEPGHLIRNCPKKDESRSISVSKSVSPNTCWFCLSNPASRKHLIVDIGDEAYVALAKGPLTSDHIIIVPIEHVSSTAGPDSVSQNIRDETEALMRKVNSLFPGKQCIFFRLGINPSHHMHVQAIFIDSVKLTEFLQLLESTSKQFGFSFELRDDSNDTDAFFEFSYISSKKNEICKLTHFFESGSYFPAQFGRQVLADFLKIEGGADWKSQLYTEDDERKFVLDLKNRFAK